MKTALIVLVVIAIALGSSSILLSRRVSALEQNVRTYQSILESTGRRVGKQQAERDFASGTPRWYRTGEPGGVIPTEKQDRQLVEIGCEVSEYDRAFVEAYNGRMDEFFARRAVSGKR
jgi:hypothetical protein